MRGELPTQLADRPPRPGEQVERRGALPARVARREQRADVLEPRRPENRVGECMGEDVPVGVAGEALLERDADAAEGERDPCDKLVGVEGRADQVSGASKSGASRSSASGSSARVRIRVACGGGSCR